MTNPVPNTLDDTSALFPDVFEGHDRSQPPPPLRIRASDSFNIIYRSGKGIVQTHRAGTHWAFSNAIELGMGEASRALSTTALYANGNWLMMLPVLFAGGTCVVMPVFEPGESLATVLREPWWAGCDRSL